MKQKNGKIGFTMVEAMVVLTILALLAAIGVPTMRAFLMRSEQTARDNTARTIFMVAQTALTNRRAALRATGEPLSGQATVNLYEITPAGTVTEEELQVNGQNISYLSIDMGAAQEGNALAELIGPYLSDRMILSQSILVEYNVVTGNVLAAFYSDQAASLGYSGAGYNVYHRDVSALKAAQVGYYGVDSTGIVFVADDVNDIEIALVDYDNKVRPGNSINHGDNYGLLTVECTLPATLSDTFTYRIDLMPQTGLTDAITITADSTNAANADLLFSDVRSRVDLTDALQHPFTVALPDGSGTRKVAAYLDSAAGRTVLVLILDCQTPGLSILENYPGLGNGYLMASLTVSNSSVSATKYSTTEHTLFADRTGTANAPEYTVASIRHLNNIRYASSGVFSQTAHIFARDYAGSLVAFEPIYDAYNADSPAFTGSYTGKSGGASYEIRDLTIAVRDRRTTAGLFAETAAGSTVSNVTLAYTADYLASYENAATSTAFFLHGTNAAGGIAGVNRGTIERCTVFGLISAESATGVAGGIAADNQGVIRACFTAANINGASAAGGVAGTDSGTISYCEVGTGSANSTLYAKTPEVVGTVFFGAAGRAATAYNPTGKTDNNRFSVNSNGSTGYAGGIVGYKTDGKLLWCVNAAQVNAAINCAGGLIGGMEIDSALSVDDPNVYCSYNAGSVFGARIAGGVVGYSAAAVVDSCYNTGYVNIYFTYSSVYRTNLVKEMLHTAANAGGLVGQAAANLNIRSCYNMQYAGGEYSGAFGLIQKQKVTVYRCYFLENVQNTSSLCWQNTGNSQNKTLASRSGLAALSASELRRLDVGQLHKSSDGASVRQVGDFKYSFPYLVANDAVCTLGDHFHRTLWFRSLEEKGSVLLSDNNGRITVNFCLYESSADLVLRTDVGSVTVPLTKETLAAMRGATADNPVQVAGTDGDGNAYSFSCYAAALQAGSEKFEQGYTHQYTLISRWSPAYADALPAGAGLVSGALYQVEHAGDNAYLICTGNQLSRIDFVQVVYVAAGNTTEVHFFVSENTTVTSSAMKILYGDGTEQVVGLSAADIASAPQSEADALKNKNKHNWLTLDNGNDRHFPLYESTPSSADGFREYVVLLNGDFTGNSSLNGLHTGKLYVRVTINGVSYKSATYDGIG